MDILDIVNSHLKERELLIINKIQEIVTKLNAGESFEQLSVLYNVEPSLIKNYLEKENYQIDLNSHTWIKETKAEAKEENLSADIIHSVPYKLYYGNNLSVIAKQYNVSITTLKDTLSKYNYKKRWTSIINAQKSAIHPEILKTLHLINTEKYSLQDVANKLKNNVDEVKETLDAANFRKVWTLESTVDDSTIKTYIEGFTIERDLDTGILENIITSGINYYTSTQVNTILGINTNYFYNSASNKFILNKHFLRISKEAEKKIIYAIPTLNKTKFDLLFSELGLNMLAELSKREESLSKYRLSKENTVNNTDFQNDRYRQHNDSGIFKETKALLENVDKISNDSHSPLFEEYIEEEDLKIEEIVQRLNTGESLYDISKYYVINRKLRVPFVTKLQTRLEVEGYTYYQSTKQWVLKNNDTCEYQKKEVSPKLRKSLDIIEIVAFLNKENSFQKAQEKFGVNTTELRILIKNKGYKYDGFFKLWTKKSRNALLSEVTSDLREGGQTYKELEKRGVNISELAKEIERRDVLNEEINRVISTIKDKKATYESTEVLEKKSRDNSDTFNVDRIEVINTNEFQDKKIEDISGISNDEIKILRQIISEWKNSKSSDTTKATFRINKQLLEQVDNYSEANMISKSMVLEKALNKFFENILSDNEYHDGPSYIISESDAPKRSEGKDLKVHSNICSNNWDANKESILITSVLEGIREGRTMTSIIEDVSKEIEITPSACQSYWSNKVPREYKDEFDKIKLEQEQNWSAEDLEIFKQLIFVEYAHLTPYEVLPIASKRLKKHINAIRKKWYELQRIMKVQID